MVPVFRLTRWYDNTSRSLFLALAIVPAGHCEGLVGSKYNNAVKAWSYRRLTHMIYACAPATASWRAHRAAL